MRREATGKGEGQKTEQGRRGLPPHASRPTPLIVIVGPTAAGKTEAGIQVALRVGGEVISADSRQVYRGMDIGTAKPSREDRERVPHHLIDVVGPEERYNAGRFSREAQAAIDDIVERGRCPVVVGGCGFYVRALLDGFSPTPEVGPEARARIRAEAVGVATGSLHARLERADPVCAGRISPSDRQRILRALEVFEETGEPLSSWQARPREGGYSGGAVIVALRWDRETLYRRIEERTDRMFEDGLVEEVAGLRRLGYLPEGTALGTFGYREVFDHLEGRSSLEETRLAVQRETRRYAKRQMTWFRGEPRVRWLEGTAPDLMERILDFQ